MKVLKTSAIGVLLTLFVLRVSAQESIHLKDPDYNKPHLFDDLPQKMKLRMTDLEGLLNLSVGASVKVFLADNFQFKGTIVSSAKGSETVRSVVVRSSDRKGATLTVTQTLKDGTFKYLGRIISLENGDAFDIVKENNEYVLEKKNLYDIISE
jgi:hypothetical protein